jgi:hypothetical protein
MEPPTPPPPASFGNSCEASDAVNAAGWNTLGLHWASPEGDRPFAGWARYFLNLGDALAQLPWPAGERTAVALALPILQQCAVLTAAGIVCRLTRTPIAAQPNNERFTELAQLAPGQPVRVLARGRLYIGEIADLPADRTAHSFPIMVSREPGYAEHFRCTATNCSKVEVTDAPSQADGRQNGLRIIEDPEFAMKVLTGVSLESLCLGTRLDYALVGVRARLLEEAGQSVRLGSGKGGLVGSFMDLLRLKNGSRDHRGLVIAATAKEPRFPTAPPRIVIFNGAPGYLKFRDQFRLSHQLVLLDRAEARFREAATQINRDYLQRTGDPGEELVAAAPAGVDRVVFTERT